MAKLTKEQIREAAEGDLYTFARLVNHNYAYGSLHEKVFRWLSSPESSKRQLLLLPRGHLKSHCIATWAAWEITRKPWTTLVYLSAGEDLAKDQIYAIKNMMTSPVYRRYWPEMLAEKEGDREHWSAYSFNVDHPVRKERGIRDHTIIVKTVKSNFTGLHCGVLVFDDVVVPNNAYSEVGRKEVQRSLSQCTSILNPGGTVKSVGTRYHPKDAYADMIAAKYRIWDEVAREFINEEPLWETLEEVVEDHGDGTGNFLWPRTFSNSTEEWYGFDTQELEMIQADYRSRNEMPQYYAQYYNDPNDESTNLLDRSLFQYYEPSHLKVTPFGVYHKNKKLNIAAAMDVAWTEVTNSGGRSDPDYTAIAVIGADEDGYYYVLDLARFRTSNFQIYYDNVINLSEKWGFRKIVVETNSGGKLVAQEIQRLSREAGSLVSVEQKSNAGFGTKSKLMRQYALVNPKYELQSIFHRKDGLTSVLEEELVLERPPHDDLVDALGMAIEHIKIPSKTRHYLDDDSKVITDVRFGGKRGRR